MAVELAPALLAGILGAQIVQIGFEVTILRISTENRTKIEERTTPTYD